MSSICNKNLYFFQNPLMQRTGEERQQTNTFLEQQMKKKKRVFVQIVQKSGNSCLHPLCSLLPVLQLICKSPASVIFSKRSAAFKRRLKSTCFQIRFRRIYQAAYDFLWKPARWKGHLSSLIILLKPVACKISADRVH